MAIICSRGGSCALLFLVVLVCLHLSSNVCDVQDTQPVSRSTSPVLGAEAAHPAGGQAERPSLTNSPLPGDTQQKTSTTTTKSTTDDGYQAMVDAAKEELEANIKAERDWEEAWIQFAMSRKDDRGSV
ncbi:hypothetical protein CSUI_005085 [Cystoisospora suis]|uniref:Transmembrane protein n=1 Tax=Cystoisospora suis TaxID=483139 RepID=A0A2C6KYU9_9APIC|nr:hypothetical protein CSUI_005085 [Cystoisospora suis]